MKNPRLILTKPTDLSDWSARWQHANGHSEPCDLTDDQRRWLDYQETLDDRETWLLVAVSVPALAVGLVLLRFFVNLVLGD